MRVLLLLALCVTSLAGVALANEVAQDDQAKLATAVALQSRSSSGVIELTTAIFDELATGKSRPFSLFIVADAKHLHSQEKLGLVKLMKEFALVAKAFADTHKGTPSASKVVFAHMEFSVAKDLFGRLGVQSVPYLVRIAPGTPVAKDGAVSVAKADVMDVSSYPWDAETLAAFVQDRTGVSVGEIVRPAAVRSRFLPLLTLAVMAGLGLLGQRLYHAAFMRHPAIYIAGALVVWWFSVSGGMHNIIRGVPLVGYDPATRKSMLFTSGHGQLGAEGFIMGTLYCTVGLVAAAFTNALPRVADPAARRYAGYGLLAAAVIAMHYINTNHQWKAGMRAEWYFPLARILG